MEEFTQQLLTGFAIFAILCLIGYWIGSGSSSRSPDENSYCNQYECW